MRYVIILICLFPTMLQAGEVSREPLPVFQANPAMMRFLDPRPVAAGALESEQSRWSLNQSYTSIFLADALPAPSRYLADMELYVADFGWRYGLGMNTDITVNFPLIRPLAGKMDGFLHNYHRALGLPNGGREARPNNQFGYFLSGNPGWNSSSRWEAGNLRMNVKHALPELLPTIQLAIQGSVQFSTANRLRGWSHGGTDAALGGVLSWQGGAFSSHINLWWVHPFKRNDAGYAIKDYARASATLGYAMHWHGEAFNLMLQVQGGNSPYQTGIPALDSAPWLVSFGFRTVTDSGQQWSFTFVENITQKSTQDFGITIGLSL